jgi:hypothetical protein
LDISRFFSIEGARRQGQRGADEKHFWEALKTASALAMGSCVALHVASSAMGYADWW